MTGFVTFEIILTCETLSSVYPEITLTNSRESTESYRGKLVRQLADHSNVIQLRGVNKRLGEEIKCWHLLALS